MRPFHLSLALLALCFNACPDDGNGGLADTTATSSDGEVTTTTGDTTTSSPDTDATTTTTTTTTPDTTQDVEVGPPSIGWAITQFPADYTGQPGASFAVYGRVYAAGVTDGAGQGVGIVAEAGVGSGAVEGWTWVAAQFNVDVDGANDEYLANIVAPNDDGEYRYAFRFKLGDGDWVYADRDSTDDGFDVADAGLLTVVTPDPATIDWCILQFPSTLEANPGAPVGTIFGQVYEPGMTDTLSGTDDGYTLVGELGWGTGSDTAAWTWVAAQYAKDVGNNDELEATFEAPAIGTYRFAYRFRFKAEPNGWIYCDLDGSDDGFAIEDAGTLSVVAPPPKTIDYATLRPALAEWAVSEPAPTFEVVVYEPGVTDAVGQGESIIVELGYGEGDVTEAGLTWIAADYQNDENGLGVNDNDVYGAKLPAALAAGGYRVVARITLEDGAPVLVDATGTGDGFALGDSAIANISTAVAPIVDWCRLVAPEVTTAAPGGLVSNIVVQVYEAGVTPESTTIIADIGIGPFGGAAENVGTWFPAPRDGSAGNDDIFEAELTAPLEEGNYNLVGRVKIGADGPWVYCDDDGSHDGYDGTQTARLTVAAPKVDFCKIQFPTDDVTVSLSSPDGAEVYGLVYEAGVTGENGSHTLAIDAEVGFGAAGSSPTSGWTWVAGSFNGYLDNGFGQKTNDEFRGVLDPTSSGGPFAWAWRFSLDGGASWTYCDEAGTQPFDPAKAGVLQVVP